MTWIDRLGSAASIVCAVHCALLAFAPAFVAVLGMEILAGEAFEWSFFAIAIAFAGVSAAQGFRAHRSAWVPVGFGAGALLLLSARLVEVLSLFEGGAILAVLGGIVLVASHLANTWQARSCAQACC